MKRYEGLFILNTAGREEGVKDTLDKISAEISAAGGKVETVQNMDRKHFARVSDKKHNAGFLLVEKLAATWKCDWANEKKFRARIAKTERNGKRFCCASRRRS